MVKHFVFVFVILSCTTCRTQSTIEDYQGNWEGKISDTNGLNFAITIEDLDAEKALLTVANSSAEELIGSLLEIY